MTNSRVEARRLGISRRWLILAALAPYVVTTGLPGLHAIQAGLLVAGIVFGRLSADPVRRLRWEGPERLLLAFLAWATLSCAWSDGPAQTLLTGASLTGTYLSLRMLVARYASAAEAMLGLAGVVHILLVWSAAQLIIWPEQAYRAIGYDPTQRLISLYPTVGSNLLAFLAVLGLVLLLLDLGPRWTHPNPAKGLLLMVYVAELGLTRTRSAWAIGAVVLCIALVAACRRSPWPMALGCFSVPAIALVAVWKWDAVSEYLQRGQSTQGLTTLTGRTTAWHEALLYFQKSPWVGHGYYSGHRVGLLAYRQQTLTNLDNTWIEALVDVGILGAVLLGLFFLAGAVRALRRSDSGVLRVWVLCVLLYGLLASFINPSLQETNISQLMLGWCILAHAASQAHRPECVPGVAARDPDRSRPREHYARLSPTGGAPYR